MEIDKDANVLAELVLVFSARWSEPLLFRVGKMMGSLWHHRNGVGN